MWYLIVIYMFQSVECPIFYETLGVSRWSDNKIPLKSNQTPIPSIILNLILKKYEDLFFIFSASEKNKNFWFFTRSLLNCIESSWQASKSTSARYLFVLALFLFFFFLFFSLVQLTFSFYLGQERPTQLHKSFWGKSINCIYFSNQTNKYSFMQSNIRCLNA